MRKKLCIGMILRSDDTVASGGTLSSFLRIGQAVSRLGITLEFLPVMGAGKDLARCEVLGAYRALSKADDLLFVDFGNSLPGINLELAEMTLAVLLTSEKPALWCPYTVRGGKDLSYACSLPGDMHPRTYIEYEDLEVGKIRLMKLGGCGFGWTRLRRDYIEDLWRRNKGRTFWSDRTDLTGEEIECVDLFSSMLSERPGQDIERRDKPMRLLPEDDSFWRRSRDTGIRPYALVDFPISHGKTVPGFNAPTFAEFYGLDAEEIVSEARVHDSIPPNTN